MSFSKKTQKFNHYVISSEHTTYCLLGVNRDISIEEATILLDTPLVNYSCNLWNSFFRLNHKNRQVISKCLEEIQNNNATDKFDSNYWIILKDFLMARNGVSLADISKTLAETEEWRTESMVYHNLDKLKNVKTPKEDTVNLLKYACSFYLITHEILYTGQGKMYTLTSEAYQYGIAEKVNSLYTINAIKNEYDKNPLINLKDLIMNVTGIDEKYLEEITLQISTDKKRITEDQEKTLCIFMNALHKYQ